MKTKAPSSMKRFAAARPMPVAPPVMTAVFPFSLVMSCFLPSVGHRLCFRWSEDRLACVRCSVRKFAHRRCKTAPDELTSSATACDARRSVLGYDDSLCYPHTRCCLMHWTRPLEGAPDGARLHHDRLGRCSLLSCRRAWGLGPGRR